LCDIPLVLSIKKQENHNYAQKRRTVKALLYFLIVIRRVFGWLRFKCLAFGDSIPVGSRRNVEKSPFLFLEYLLK